MTASQRIRGLSNRSRWLLPAVLILGLLLSGCAGMTGSELSTLPDDGPPPATSTDALGRFVRKASAAAQVARETGRFELVITEEEANSVLQLNARVLEQSAGAPLESALDRVGLENRELAWLRENLIELKGTSVQDRARFSLRPSIVQPVVYFGEGGRITLRGEFRWLLVEFPARIVIAPRASEGQLTLDFVEGQIGGVVMPELLFDLLGRGITELVLLGQDYGRLTEISVAPRTVTVRGEEVR